MKMENLVNDLLLQIRFSVRCHALHDTHRFNDQPDDGGRVLHCFHNCYIRGIEGIEGGDRRLQGWDGFGQIIFAIVSF